MKRVPKTNLRSPGHLNKALTERAVLLHNNSPFTVKLHFAFQTAAFLYYVIDFAKGGELFTILQKNERFSEKSAKLYIAELVLAIEHMHNRGIHHGDLKLENVLLDGEGHVLLADFDCAKIKSCKGRVEGTMEYLSPEAILRNEDGPQRDWWAMVG